MATESSIRPIAASADATPVTFEELYAQHRHAVYSWARRYCGSDPADAEDLTSEVFIKLFTSMPEIDPARAGAWLYRVTANLAISRGRARRSFLKRLGAVFFERLPPPHPVAVLEAREEMTHALEELDRLPARERVVVCMKIVDGMTQIQIAEALALSQGHVSRLLARGFARLRERGWELPDG
ncbi:MAG TPA: sigma-70 family RNA polymerase sigma factor [Kofleriaceae bacterium]|nr:sigma-70 family RNA polymerase sigma factor [Kofleriaceae bacterium]